MYRRFFPLLLLVLVSAPVWAQDVVPATYRRNVLWLPALGATPETGFLFVGVVMVVARW